MITTIDKGGRVVIPKAMRDALGLGPDSEVVVELDEHAGTIALSSRPVPKRVVVRDGSAAIVADEALPPLTQQRVRDILERARDRDLY